MRQTRRQSRAVHGSDDSYSPYFDLLGLSFWAYVILKLFFLDVDRVVLDSIAPEAAWLLGYRAIFLLIGIALVSAFFWKWRTLGAVLYVIFFPCVVLTWKLPVFTFRTKLYRNWLLWLAIINGLIVFGRNLRYYMFSKTTALIAAVTILLTNTRYAIVPASIVLAALLIWAVVRVIIDTFRPSWSWKAQKEVVDFASSKLLDFKWGDAILARKDEGALDTNEAQQVAMRIQFAVLFNRATYFWAYRLQQYRRSNIEFLFNALSYIWLLIGSVTVFWLLNLTLLKVDPGQYSFSSYPSELAVAVYSLSNFALGDGGGITASGDAAYLLSLIAGIYGPFFLLTVFVNFIISFKGSRGDAELDETVQDLRRTAHQQEATFQNALLVSFEEACERLVSLQLARFFRLIQWLQESVPPDFIEESG